MSTVPSSKSRIVPAPDLFPAGASGKCPVPAPRDRESQKRSRTQTPSLQRLSTPHRTPSNSSGIYERTGRSAASIAIILPRASFSDMQCRPRDRRANARISRQHRTSHRKLPVHKGIIPGTHRSLGSQLPNKRGFIQLSVRTAACAPSKGCLFISHLYLAPSSTSSVQSIIQ